MVGIENNVSAVHTHCVMADLDALRADGDLSTMFIAETLDHLSTIEASLLQLEGSPADVRILDAVFRPFHTIKGNSGALGVQTVQELAHRVESLLDVWRTGRHRIGSVQVDVVLQAVDVLTAMVTDLGDRLAGGPGRHLEPARQQVMARVDRLIAHGGEAPAGVGLVDATLPAFDPTTRARRHRADDATVKVDTRKLDDLIDAVGDLVVVQALIAEELRHTVMSERLRRNLLQLRRTTSELRRTAMSMRMVPIGEAFRKMSRLVRDLSRTSGKPVDLQIEGEHTELDRKVVETINDPLMHMVRNSVDHGLEPAALRTRRGKPLQGRVVLRAYRERDTIVIEIEDDGGGIDGALIRQTAVARGLVAADADLSNDDVHRLIFQPGFSTAGRVTEISGRGVGMDVVRRNIEALRGRVDIASTPGVGTTFAIRLPLTLAIVDGLLLRPGDEHGTR